MAAQAQCAAELDAIAADVPPDTVESERMGYWQGQVGFLPPYLKAWNFGRELENLLDSLFKLRKTGENIDTRIVYEQAIPLWIKVLEQTRAAVLRFQHTVATRNDLGMLASIHNKFVRIATFRLQQSIVEFIDELPAEAQAALDAATAPDVSLLALVIVPTRPTRLAAGESAKITAIATGSAEVIRVDLMYRKFDQTAGETVNMELVGRRTYCAEITMPFVASGGIEYHVRAEYAGTPAPITSRSPAEGYYCITR